MSVYLLETKHADRNVLESAFVSRINRRVCILIVKLFRPTYDVQIRLLSGWPLTSWISTLLMLGGLYSRRPSTLATCHNMT